MELATREFQKLEKHLSENYTPDDPFYGVCIKTVDKIIRTGPYDSIKKLFDDIEGIDKIQPEDVVTFLTWEMSGTYTDRMGWVRVCKPKNGACWGIENANENLVKTMNFFDMLTSEDFANW